MGESDLGSKEDLVGEVMAEALEPSKLRPRPVLALVLVLVDDANLG